MLAVRAAQAVEVELCRARSKRCSMRWKKFSPLDGAILIASIFGQSIQGAGTIAVIVQGG